MKKLLLFGGTSEEHALIQQLKVYPIAITLCVAGAYGRALLPENNEKLSVRVGRLKPKQMIDMIRRENFFCIVDATHPYATEVTANIKTAAAKMRIPYLRLLREKSETGDGILVSSPDEAAVMVGKLSGAALITTGSKGLAAFTRIPDFARRLYPRVLPRIKSIQTCLDLGFAASRIIAMQGPFSKELNRELMRQFDIKILVTKESGSAGGFPEKKEAARELGVQLIVLRRPPETGFFLNEIIFRVLTLMEEKN